MKVRNIQNNCWSAMAHPEIVWFNATVILCDVEWLDLINKSCNNLHDFWVFVLDVTDHSHVSAGVLCTFRQWKLGRLNRSRFLIFWGDGGWGVCGCYVFLIFIFHVLLLETTHLCFVSLTFHLIFIFVSLVLNLGIYLPSTSCMIFTVRGSKRVHVSNECLFSSWVQCFVNHNKSEYLLHIVNVFVFVLGRVFRVSTTRKIDCVDIVSVCLCLRLSVWNRYP